MFDLDSEFTLVKYVVSRQTFHMIHLNGRVPTGVDSLSDLVLSVGFEKTYRFMRYAVEMLASPRNTVLFLLNQNTHDPKVTSSLRGLFSNQIPFGKEGIQTVKLSKTELGKIET
jgi:hypothetical protein